MAKTKQKKWTKFHHKVVWFTLSPVFRLYFKLRYRLTVKREKPINEPCLILGNHYTTMDPFMLGLSFKKPVYFVASDDLFSIPVLSPIIKWLVNPIPKTKSKSDLSTIKNTLKVLKEGYSVALFPEGNRSLSGGIWGIDEAIAKLIKLAKVPVLFYHIEGGYGTDPRWGKKLRKGKMTASVTGKMTAEEVKSLSPEEVYAKVCENIYSNDYLSGVKFKSKTRAEYLERALYYCPNCKSFCTLRSEKTNLTCDNCDFTAEYNEDLTFTAKTGDLPFTAVKDWFDFQQTVLKERFDETVFTDVAKTRIIDGHKRKKLIDCTLTANKNSVTVSSNLTTNTFNYEDLYGVTVLGKRKINYYLPDGTALQIKGDDRFNAIKYLNLYEFYKSED